MSRHIVDEEGIRNCWALFIANGSTKLTFYLSLHNVEVEMCRRSQLADEFLSLPSRRRRSVFLVTLVSTNSIKKKKQQWSVM